ncbi:MAG: hypothetical protein A2275_00150 [Bacteroidetes bacterium RIFOXYA12_FULL_35_11]|nr:MAG: hypothetical protein A2X01_15770 [Bacteroidetes bacterium GWF2_35_48]OFY82165.1 MAG: hypothetical protein A2275_00150 [Bacteroidetes bacterium RIFOXYA12_FULL_35_11]OFY97822.1 MAG: hypothetical protein A2309_13305 [Bacteroidetes bacterium RIFOXYB2_FULL_35_7]OFZ05656.1 MAG: hypothetical protein A2491_20395 [Bacteroidetes bacterium RIFOXYC12_FULL_35_7]HBX52703.1 hypothetical protein [Bacteroidales bacterium]
MNYVNFFSDLGFNFKVDLMLKPIDMEEKSALIDRLKKSVFFYKSPSNTNTSFYLITTELRTNEFEKIRKYIWNKNDADLIFYYPNEATKLEMYYAKYSPKISNKESTIDIFTTIQKDFKKFEKINKWQFDSGAFWLNYQSFIDKAKYRGIDKELVSTLKTLKDNLYDTLYHLISEENELNKIVQALIDRTLYIKFLEDNHIINSHFYNHYFVDSTLNYGKLLVKKTNTDINKLFKKIHEIFNNALFDQPTIDDKYLTSDVRNLIAASFNTEKTGQLRLFDFQFNVLPIELISNIYEVFLSEEQKKNGIYYTPKKLAQLIVDDVINEDKIGSILDPSCGSGMFLIVGFQRLLEIAQKQKKEPENNIKKIEDRIKLLSENIFGVEKTLTAQRFTLFSLSLQIFKNIPAEEIKLFIANELERNQEIKIFKEHNFFKNIICQNTLDINNLAFEGRTFDYIVGNPPFVRKEVSEEAKDFTNKYELEHLGNKYIAKNIIEGYQISQCFLLKIKEWSKLETRFGFISNSSNFYNEAEKFQKFFYSNYGIEKIYELSRVKDILFEKAKESVVAIIFTNNYQNNVIDYYPVDKGLFSEKPFDLLIIQEDKVIQIEQEKLIGKKIRLRDFLMGNDFDRLFINKFNEYSKLENLLDIKDESIQGLTRKSNKEIADFFNLSISHFKKLKKKDKKKFQKEFELKNYLSENLNNNFKTPYLYEYSNINHFKINNYDGFINLNSITKENFQRPRDVEIFREKKILITRVGNSIKAVYTPFDIVFSVNIFGVKVLENKLNCFITALLNSNLINYIINIRDKKRIGDNLPRIDGSILKNIPIPKELDQDLVTQISNISKDLTEGKYKYSVKENELNELIFDLYELSYLERQRIKDYLLSDAKKPTTNSIIKNYTEALIDTLEFYFSQKITIENFNDFNLRVIKVFFGTNNNPTAKEVGLYSLEQIFKEYQNGKFFLEQEFIFGKDCVYILKKDINQNWTETKAFEDGQSILKFTPYEQKGLC